MVVFAGESKVEEEKRTMTVTDRAVKVLSINLWFLIDASDVYRYGY